MSIAGMHPFGAGRALVRLDDVAAHHDDRHAVAPGVVHRHGGVLQADHAVADHGDRLAFDLGVALRHVDGDLLVRAGEDFGLVVAAVVEHGLVQAAEARGAVHRQIFDVERLEHVDHEVAAARGLVDRILDRRHGLGRDLPRPGNGGLSASAARPAARWRPAARPRRRRRQAAPFRKLRRADQATSGVSAWRLPQMAATKPRRFPGLVRLAGNPRDQPAT